jgi:hypothetical protein
MSDEPKGEPRWVVALLLGGGKAQVVKPFPYTTKGKRRAGEFKKARNEKKGGRHVVMPMTEMPEEGAVVDGPASGWAGKVTRATYVKTDDVPFMGSTGTGPNETAADDELRRKVEAAQQRGDTREVARLVGEALKPFMDKARETAANPPRDPFHTGILGEEGR